jgi:DNA polymerase-4
LGRRRRSFEEIDSSVIAIVDRIARRLRTGRRLCRTVVLRLRFDDFTRATRSLTMPRLTDQSATILDAARTLLRAAWPLVEARGITLVGISLTNLQDADPLQLVLDEDWRLHALDEALDRVRDCYGSNAITRAVLVGRDQGISMPLLAD